MMHVVTPDKRLRLARLVNLGVYNCGPLKLGRRLIPFLIAVGSLDAGPANQLWDLTEVRQRPVETVRITMPYRASPGVAVGRDWMNTGDSWVSKEGGGKVPGISSPTAPGETLLVEELFLRLSYGEQEPDFIYCAVARPEMAAGAVPVVLVFHGGGGHASPALALATARRHPGMAAVAMDYNGQFMPGTEGKVTRWKSVTKEMLAPRLDLVPDARNWPMHRYVLAARRTIDYLETQPWADRNRIGAVGISYGGWVALLLAGVDSRVKCVATGVSAGGAGLTAGRSALPLRWEPAEQRSLWLANYEPLAHARQTRAAVFFQLAANDLFFWLNGAAKNLEALAEKTGWVIRPNSNHGVGGPEVPNTAAPAFMRHILADGPPLPEVRDFRASDDGQAYSWSAIGPRKITRAVLSWSPGNPVSPAKYWIEFPGVTDGGRWSARLPEEFSQLAGEAFVNVADEEGLVVSSALLSRSGADPMTSRFRWGNEVQIWDTIRGTAAWRSPAGWMPKTVFSVNNTGRLLVGPEPGGKEFMLLTNSVILASGSASHYLGLRLRVDGRGRTGEIKVALLRDTNSLDERSSIAGISYGAELGVHLVEWSRFRPEKADAKTSDRPFPFDGLVISGRRDDGSAIAVHEIAFVEKLAESRPDSSP